MALLASGGSIGVFLYVEALQIGVAAYILLIQEHTNATRNWYMSFK